MKLILVFLILIFNRVYSTSFIVLRHIRLPTNDEQYHIRCPYNLNYLTLQLLNYSNENCFNLYSTSNNNACKNHQSSCQFHAKPVQLHCHYHSYSKYVNITYQCSSKYIKEMFVWIFKIILILFQINNLFFNSSYTFFSNKFFKSRRNNCFISNCSLSSYQSLDLYLLYLVYSLS
jgi:hypothetical protein